MKAEPFKENETKLTTTSSKELQVIDQKPIENHTHRIITLHSKGMSCFEKGLAYFIEVGGELIKVKNELGHGHFGAYCEKLPFKERAAQYYMEFYKNRELLKTHRIADMNEARDFLNQIKQTQDDPKLITIQSQATHTEPQATVITVIDDQEETQKAIIHTVEDEAISEQFRAIAASENQEWIKNQPKTNSISNRALGLMFALERQPLNNVDNEYGQKGMIHWNLTGVIDSIFKWIANGTSDTDGTKTVILLNDWVQQALVKYRSEKAKKNAVNAEKIKQDTN